jgi:hypothetical protein
MGAINWEKVFEEAAPEAGASAAELAELAAGFAFPLSGDEVSEIVRRQRNPFLRRDPLYRSWKPIDPRPWRLPARKLPRSYLGWLRWSNGGLFRNGEREFGFFPALDSKAGVRAMLLAYEFPEYMPGALPFALNGGGTFYVFDMRKPAVRGEYPIFCAYAGNLGFGRGEGARVAPTLLAACRGTTNVDDLL